jgi:hypothetical protein
MLGRDDLCYWDALKTTNQKSEIYHFPSNCPYEWALAIYTKPMIRWVVAKSCTTLDDCNHTGMSIQLAEAGRAISKIWENLI